MTDGVLTIPGFSRVEIRVRGKSDLILAACELRMLATQLDEIAAAKAFDEPTAAILAHHKIKATSKKLRGH